MYMYMYKQCECRSQADLQLCFQVLALALQPGFLLPLIPVALPALRGKLSLQKLGLLPCLL